MAVCFSILLPQVVDGSFFSNSSIAMRISKTPLNTRIAILFILFTVGCVSYEVVSSASYNAVELNDCSHGRQCLTRRSFPHGFVFGTATSAYQVEGMSAGDGRGPSIWDSFVKIPGVVADGSTGDIADDQYHRYKEDVDIMADLNFDAYRFSISWSRIFPNGTGKVNWKGVEYYNKLINYLIQKGITPYANLYHYDLPLALEKKYLGFLNRQIVNDFADYADFCFETFGDRVKHWMAFNEPRVIAELGYDNGLFAPGRCSRDFGNCTAGDSATEPYIVGHNLILSHAAAVHRYRHKYQRKQKGKIGILLDFLWYEPLTRKKRDRDAAQRARDFHFGWFIHPIVYGEYPKTMQEIVGKRLPRFRNTEVKMVHGSVDFAALTTTQPSTLAIQINPSQECRVIS